MTTNLTDLQLLDLSIDAYAPQGNSSRIPDGYQRLDLPHVKLTEDDKDEGFAGSAYYNPQTQKLVVAFAGTDQFIGLVSDLDDDSGFVTGSDIAQFPIAIGFYDDAIRKVKNDFDHDLPVEDITTTGHSLGGGLGAMVGIKEGVEARIFNAPGVGRQLDNIERIEGDNINSGDLTSQDASSFNVKNVVLETEWVNYGGNQVGTVEKIDSSGTVLGTVFYAISGIAGAAIMSNPIGAGVGMLGKFIISGIKDHMTGSLRQAVKNEQDVAEDPTSKTIGQKFSDAVGSIDAYIDQGINSVVGVINGAIDWISSGGIQNMVSDVADAASSVLDMLTGLFSGGNSGDVPENIQNIDNSSLDFQVNIDENSNNATADPNDALTGTVIPGGDYAASIPEDIANVDDYSNAQLTKIASDDLRIANDELADNSVDNILDKTMNFIQDTFVEPVSNLASNIWSGVTSAFSTITNLFTQAPKVQNVDPLILDLNNNGVELIHFDNSIVSFDVDNDGYKENTGWVDGNDGILVHDKNADGVINDITETISEYYNANDSSVLIDDQNRYFADGLEALKALDSNDDNIFNNQDDLWNTLRVWQDENEDGLTDEGEIKTLEEHNIESIDLNRQISYRERLEGNPVLSRSNMTMTDGTTREVAAVDFATNPIGYEWNDAYEQGSIITTEDGESSQYSSLSLHLNNLNPNSVPYFIGFPACSSIE